jgi:hypothetical protein
MGRIKPKTVSNLMDIKTYLQMAKMRATTKEHNHQKTTGEIDTTAKGGDLTITTTTVLTAK